MKIVYIAGPFTGPTAWDIENNVRYAEGVALQVARAGAMPLCPHANTRFFHGQCTPEFWYEGTLELLRRCDAIVMCQGWRESTGSRVELAEAQRLGKKVFYSMGDIGDWARETEEDQCEISDITEHDLESMIVSLVCAPHEHRSIGVTWIITEVLEIQIVGIWDIFQGLSGAVFRNPYSDNPEIL